jgi:regulator of nonsense transcripts 2
MANFLEVMMKLRNARNLDARQSGLVDSAYFAVRAADRAVKRKQRPPQHEYIRYLVYERLPLGQVTKVGGAGETGWGGGLGRREGGC